MDLYFRIDYKISNFNKWFEIDTKKENCNSSLKILMYNLNLTLVMYCQKLGTTLSKSRGIIDTKTIIPFSTKYYNNFFI